MAKRKPPLPSQTFITPEEVGRLEAAATNLRDRLLVRVLFRLGLRVSEALALADEDIDLAGGNVRVLKLKDRVALHCPGCGKRLARDDRFCPGCARPVEEPEIRLQEARRQRVLPLEKGTAALLGEFLERGGTIERDGRRLLFPIGRRRAWAIVSALALKARLGRLLNPETGRPRGVSPHRLRDALAVHAVGRDSSGKGLRLLQEQLGHRSFNTTAKYVKIAGEEHRAWAEGLWEEGGEGGEPQR